MLIYDDKNEDDPCALGFILRSPFFQKLPWIQFGVLFHAVVQLWSTVKQFRALSSRLGQ